MSYYPGEREDERSYIGIRCSQCGKEEQVPEEVANRMEGPFLCSTRCEDLEADQRERQAGDDYLPVEEDEAPIPRWTLQNGRLLCYDGMHVARLASTTADPELAHPPFQLDDLAALLVELLDTGAGGILPGEPYPFPVKAVPHA